MTSTTKTHAQARATDRGILCFHGYLAWDSARSGRRHWKTWIRCASCVEKAQKMLRPPGKAAHNTHVR